MSDIVKQVDCTWLMVVLPMASQSFRSVIRLMVRPVTSNSLGINASDVKETDSGVL